MIRDAALYLVMLFVIAISLVIIYVAFDAFNTEIQSAPQFTADSKAILDEQTNRFPTTWDYVFLTVFIGVIISLCILAWVLETQPALFFIIVIVIGIFGAVAGYLANAFEEVILDPILGASASNFPIMSHVISNYLVYIIGAVFLMIIVFFAKPAVTGYGGGEL